MSLRHEISAKETELLLVFRELMHYNYYAPDYLFDREQLIMKKDKQRAAENYIVPLKTFWRPIELEEYYETNMTDKRFFKKVNEMQNIERTIGQYLSKPLRDQLLKNQALVDKYREGGEETALRKHVPVVRNDKIILDKFMSHGQRRQDEALLE